MIQSNYLCRAAQLGHREAQYYWALRLLRQSLPDCDAGKEWMEKCASNGWARAEFTLFELYYNGTQLAPGCPHYPKDQLEAIKWLRRAAEHEDVRAGARLGSFLVQGKNLEKDATEAEKWLRKAAERGYGYAQNDLGYAILDGDVPTTDPVEAAVWSGLASQSKDPQIAKRGGVNFSNTLVHLTAEQQLEVDARIKDFHPVIIPEPDPMVKNWMDNPAFQLEDE